MKEGRKEGKKEGRNEGKKEGSGAIGAYGRPKGTCPPGCLA